MTHESPQNYTWLTLRSAVVNNDLDQLCSLLSEGYVCRRELALALSIAGECGYLPAVQILIKAGADVNQIVGAETALTKAVYAGHTEVVRALLEAGANWTLPKYGEVYPPLMIAAEEGNLEIVKLLVEAGADVNQVRKEIFALWRAAEEGHQEVFNYLAPLTKAELRKEAEKILSKSIRERQRQENVDPLVKELSYAALHGDLNEVKEVLKKGVNVNGFDDDGFTPLFCAVYCWSLDSISKVRVVLETGANPNLGYDDGDETPLMRAINDEICSLLIDAGADINAQRSNGETALMITAGNWGGLAKMEVLIDAGADVNAKDEDGKTALMYAAQQTVNLEIVKLLIKSGADVNARDNAGNTALSFAKKAEDNEVIQILIKVGATED